MGEAQLLEKETVRAPTFWQRSRNRATNWSSGRSPADRLPRTPRPDYPTGRENGNRRHRSSRAGHPGREPWCSSACARAKVAELGRLRFPAAPDGVVVTTAGDSGEGWGAAGGGTGAGVFLDDGRLDDFCLFRRLARPGQTPLAIFILRPDYFRTNECDFFDDKPSGKERENPRMQFEAFRGQEVGGAAIRIGSNGDSAQAQSPHGVTLTALIRTGAPRRWLSSC